MKELAEDTTFDKIQQFYLSDAPVNLTPKQEEIKERWEAAHAMMLNYKEHGTKENITIALAKRFEISQKQAYRDVRNSERLFGNLYQSNKEALRYMVTEWAKDLIKVAFADKNLKYVEKGLMIITKANNLDKEDIDLPDPDKINPPKQLIQLPIEFLRSEFAKHIDTKAKEEINNVLDKIKKLIEKSIISNYLDINTINIPHIEE